MALAPQDKTYQRTVAPGGAARLAADATPAAFGANIGADIEYTGLQLARAEQKTREANDAAAAGAAMAGARLAVSKGLTDLQANLAPGAEGFSDQADALIQQHGDEALAGIKDKRVRQLAEGELADFRTRTLASAYEFQSGKAQAKRFDDAGVQVDTSWNRMLHDTSDAAYADEQLALEKTAAAVGGPADLNAKWLRDGRFKLNDGHLTGIIDQNPQLGLDMLNSGAWDKKLAPGVHESLQRRADTAIAHRAAQAQTATNQAIAQVNADKVQIKQEVDDGHEVAPDRIAATTATAKALGQDNTVYDLNEISIRQGVNKATLPLAPEGIDNIMNPLLAKKASGTITRDEETALDQLQKIAPGRKAQYYNDPHAFAAAYGVPPPPIDNASGKGFAERVTWQRAQEASRGGVFTPTLNKDEAAPLIQAIQHGSPEDRINAAEYILRWRDGGPNVLKQLSPDSDSAFAQAVALGETNRAAMHDAIRGADAKGPQPNLKPDKDDPGTLRHRGPRGRVDPEAPPLSPEEIVMMTVGPALERRGGAFVGGMTANAINAYKRVAQTAGFTEKLHGGELQVQVNRVLGGQRGANGEWAGGLGLSNGVQTVLPPRVTQRQFDDVGSRATAAAYAAAAGGRVPSYSDRPMTDAELQSAVKVWLGGNYYALKLPDRHGTPGYVNDAKGKPFAFRFDLLAGHQAQQKAAMDAVVKRIKATPEARR